ncbi:hypothetical protein R1flu_019977 [Riccia fluitans]|uniref:Uncharacterized protein n=1 Tax=Riccia fluitans TaxID=41844 RepID=A0ABD1ZNP5_9MARC
MSLVEYALDEDDIDEDERPAPLPAVERPQAVAGQHSTTTMDLDSIEEVPQQSPIIPVQLPDVDLLLSSGNSASASTSNPQRKREPTANGSAHHQPSRKVSRGNLRPSRNPPDTAGGLLLPPQLRGRSNMLISFRPRTSCLSHQTVLFGKNEGNCPGENECLTVAL